MATTTERLTLTRPHSADVAGLYSICGDPRVWTHFPSLRHTEVHETRTMLDGWIAEWQRDVLGVWVVRRHGDPAIIGYGGCSIKRDTFWNVGYRFAFEAQGHGFATEVSLEAIRQARAHPRDLPIVAYLLAHNRASARVAEKVGLTLVHEGPDAGNPDPDAVRLVYADRALSPDVLSIVMQ